MVFCMINYLVKVPLLYRKHFWYGKLNYLTIVILATI